MRRNELSEENPEIIRAFLESVIVGQLGIMTADGYPRVLSVNFASVNNTIYFHGALEGEKFDLLSKSPKVTFHVEKQYSYVPSNWTAKDYACPATIFFESVLIKGVGSITLDREEKVLAINSLMSKHQPEGNYKPLTTDDKMYKRAIDTVTIFKVSPDSIDMKSKFGQSMPEWARKQIIQHLKKRGTVLDLETAERIQQTL